MSIETILAQPTTDTQSPSSESSPVSGTSPLDSLLSPHDPSFSANTIQRESVAESEFSGLGDESDFSTVPLSARQSTSSIASDTSIKSTSTQVGNVKEDRRRATISVAPSESLIPAQKILHKKSPSGSSVKSLAGNTPFILARLESQREYDGSDSTAHRGSVDGQHKLQEEFVRMQNEIKEEESHAGNNAIDWGTCLAFIQFSFSYELANAIKIFGEPLYRVGILFYFGKAQHFYER